MSELAVSHRPCHLILPKDATEDQASGIPAAHSHRLSCIKQSMAQLLCIFE